MDELNQYWDVALEEKHEPFTFICGQRGDGKIFFLEDMVKILKEQLKQEKIETDRWKSTALYYADKMGSAQKGIPVTERLPEENTEHTAQDIADHLAENDVVQVVRCKDCKHYTDSPYDNGDMMCDRWGEWIFPNDDDFCSCGERREGE